MSTEALSLGATPERQLPADEANLARLVTPSFEMVDSVRPKFWAIAQEATRTALTEHDRDAIYLAAHELDWEILGQPDDPLPDGLVLSQRGWDVVINRDTRRGVDASCISAAYRRFHELGLGEVLQEVWSDMASRKDETAAQLREMVMNNPVYSILQSFDVRQPRASEAPLSPFFRTIRENQLRQEVRERHALSAHESIEPYTEADFALRKSIWRLDDEVMPGMVATQDDASTRARKYFASLMAEQYVAVKGQSEGTQQELTKSLLEAEDPSSSHELLCNGVDAYDFDKHYARQVVGKTGTTCQRAVAKILTDTFVRQLFDEDKKDLTYPEVLANVVVEVVEGLQEWLNDGYDVGHSIGRSVHNFSDFLKHGNGEFVEESVLQANTLGYSHEHGRSNSTGYATRADFEKLHQTIIGYIEKGKVDRLRLIQAQSKNSHIPELNAINADLIISLTAREFERLDPSLPGYKLVGRSDERFGFIREVVDAYAKADVPIPPDSREHLADLYTQIKLTNLAEAIRRTPQLTVESLRDLIQSNSHYHLPESTRMSSNYIEPQEDKDSFPGNFEATDLEAFAPFVRDNKFFTQCSGAGDFLKLSLQEVFGKHAARTIDGYYVSPAPTINGVKHRQVVFENEGKIYILDATPFSSAMPELTDPNSRRFTFRRVRAQAQPSIQQQLPMSREASPQPPTERLSPEANRMRQIMALRLSLEFHLQALLGVSDSEGLYKVITKLPADADPLRRTAETVLRASYNEDVLSEVEGLTRYLALYKETPDAVRRQMRVASYAGHIIESLEQVAKNLAQHV